MTAAKYDLNIDQGSDFALEFTISENGLAKNLTGWAGRAQLRKDLEEDTKTDFTCSVTDAGAGKVKVELSNTTSAGLSAGTYHWGLEIFHAVDGKVSRLLQGKANINREVVR